MGFLKANLDLTLEGFIFLTGRESNQIGKDFCRKEVLQNVLERTFLEPKKANFNLVFKKVTKSSYRQQNFENVQKT